MKITKKNVKKVGHKVLRKRQIELYEEAVDSFLTVNKFCVFEHLTEDDGLEYERISFHLEETDYNPDKEVSNE